MKVRINDKKELYEELHRLQFEELLPRKETKNLHDNVCELIFGIPTKGDLIGLINNYSHIFLAYPVQREYWRVSHTTSFFNFMEKLLKNTVVSFNKNTYIEIFYLPFLDKYCVEIRNLKEKADE